MYNKKLYLRIWFTISILIFLALWLIRGGNIDMHIFSTAFTAAGITFFIDRIIFKAFIWKRKPDLFYKWLTNVPFLGGRWEGEILSNYINPNTNMEVEPFFAKLEIIHDFDRLSIKMETNKSYSGSYVSGVIINEGSQTFLCYMYSNDADKDREINPKHDGAAKLRIKHDGEIVLEGHYWTGRSTTGKMLFKRKTITNSLV